jgi:hypothetical protein
MQKNHFNKQQQSAAFLLSRRSENIKDEVAHDSLMLCNRYFDVIQLIGQFFLPLVRQMFISVEQGCQLIVFAFFFGYVVGFEKEWGSFSLRERQCVQRRVPVYANNKLIGKLPTSLERDLYFQECRFSTIPDYHR